MSSRQRDTDAHFPCPVCRHSVALPPGGVADFPNNHMLSSLNSTIIENERSQVTRQRSTSHAGTPPVEHSPSITPMRVSEPTHNHQVPLCFGQYGHDLQQLTSPFGVSVSQEGYIIISDKRDNRIMIYDFRGSLKALFYCSGDIYDIVITPSDHLIVVNAKAGSSLICKYDLNGCCVAKLGNQFKHDKPRGVALTSSNIIIVTTVEPPSVCILNENGKMLRRFRGSGLDGGRLKKPYNVAVNGKDEIIVSDCDSNCLKVFTQTGQFRFEIGTKTAQLKSPQGLCVDANDNIIVADAGNHRVVKFNSSGKLVGVLVRGTNRHGGQIGDKDVKPQSVAVTDDTLIVLLTGNEFAEVRLYPYVTLYTMSEGCPCM